MERKTQGYKGRPVERLVFLFSLRLPAWEGRRLLRGIPAERRVEVKIAGIPARSQRRNYRPPGLDLRFPRRPLRKPDPVGVIDGRQSGLEFDYQWAGQGRGFSASHKIPHYLESHPPDFFLAFLQISDKRPQIQLENATVQAGAEFIQLSLARMQGAVPTPVQAKFGLQSGQILDFESLIQLDYLLSPALFLYYSREKSLPLLLRKPQRGRLFR